MSQRARRRLLPAVKRHVVGRAEGLQESPRRAGAGSSGVASDEDERFRAARLAQRPQAPADLREGPFPGDPLEGVERSPRALAAKRSGHAIGVVEALQSRLSLRAEAAGVDRVKRVAFQLDDPLGDPPGADPAASRAQRADGEDELFGPARRIEEESVEDNI